MQNNLGGTLVIEVFCLSLILMIYETLRKNRRQETPDRTLFRWLVLAGIFVNLLDASSWIINGRMFPHAITINRIVNSLCHFSVPMMMFIWTLYLDYKITESREHVKKIALYYAIPILICFGLCIYNIFSDRFFEISAENVYQRNEAYFITITAMSLYLLHSICYVAASRKNLRKNDFEALLKFPFPMILAAIIQTFIPGISCLLMGMTFSLLVVLIYLQNSIVSEDFLTGLSNRRHLEDFITSELAKLSDGFYLAGIMLDMDHFKNINDRFGHAAGDLALESMAKVIRKSARETDLCARLAGDEFLIVAKVHSEEDMQIIIDRLHSNTDEFNQTSNTPWQLKFSIGTYLSSYSTKDNLGTFLRKLDFMMYADKQKKGELYPSE